LLFLVPDDQLTTDPMITNSSTLNFSRETVTRSRQAIVLYIIHWTNFSLLCLCLFEVSFSLYIMLW